MIAEVLHSLLLSSAATAIRDELGSYEGQKSIFTGQVPEKAGYPAIVIREISGTDFGTRGDKGAECRIDVQVFDNKTMSSKKIRSLAEQIWRLIHRHDLMPWIQQKGWQNWGVVASPPADTNDGFGFPGFTVQVTARILEL